MRGASHSRARHAHVMRLVALALVLTSLGACARGCTSRRPPIHLNPNMDDQPRYEAQAASPVFADGAAMQAPPEGTVARGEARTEAPMYEGVDADGNAVATFPMAVTEEMLGRGADRFQIYCTPCHGDEGDGGGMLRERSGVQTANLLEARFRAYPPGQIFQVITDGFGLMAGYRYPIPAEDRWAIVAHVRELQKRAGPVGPEAATDLAAEVAAGEVAADDQDTATPATGEETER